MSSLGQTICMRLIRCLPCMILVWSELYFWTASVYYKIIELENDVMMTTRCHSFLPFTFTCPCFTDMWLFSVLTLFLRVGWIVSLHHATYSRDGGSIPVDHLLPPCFFSLRILSLTFHLPIPLFFHFRFILNFV